MNTTDMQQSLDTYFRLMSMKGAVEVFHAAGRAGILRAVAAGTTNVADIAAACGMNPRATGLVLDALAATGVVARSETGYAASPALQFFSGTYADLSARYWEYLPQYMKSGLPMQHMDDPAEGMKHYVSQARALHGMMLPSAMAAAEMLGVGRSLRNLRILDIGAGSGVWSLTFARHDAGAQVTGIDWPPVLDIAGDMAAKAGLADRFTPCPGDYHRVDLGTGIYDLAIAANIAHLETEDRLVALFRRLHVALKPDGALLVVDVFHGQPDGELNAALYELGLALRTREGRLHGQAGLEACVRDAGFAGCRYQPIPVTPRTMGMILARKGAIA